MLGEVGDGLTPIHVSGASHTQVRKRRRPQALEYNIVINPFFDANIRRFQYFVQPVNIIHKILRVVLDFHECMVNNRIILL